MNAVDKCVRGGWLPVLVLVAAATAACAASLAAPTAADARRAMARWPDATLEQLEWGRRLYVKKCSGCHHLYRPAALPAGKWPAVVAGMERTYRIELSGPQRRALLRYLVTTAEAIVDLHGGEKDEP